LAELIKDISKGLGYTVSNGSFQEQAGAAAWIIEGKDHSNQLIGTIHTLGSGTDHSTFWSEVAGLLGNLLTL